MKMFHNTETMNLYHNIYKNLNVMQQSDFQTKVFSLFKDKSISEDGKYDNFKITKSDLLTIKETLTK